MGTGQHLMLSTARPIHGQTFAAKLMREYEGGSHVFRRSGSGKIDCFRHAAVAMLLEDRLHPNMMGRVDVVGGDKEPPQIFGDPGEMLNRFPVGHLSPQLSERESSGASLFQEFGMKAFQTDVFHDEVGNADSVQRLDTGGTVCQDADRAGGSNRRDGGIASTHALCVKAATLVCGEDPTLLCESARGLMGMGLDEPHQSVGNSYGLVRIVGNTKLNQEISESHDSKTDLSCPFGVYFNGRKGETGSIEDVIEKPNRERNHDGESIIIDGGRLAM